MTDDTLDVVSSDIKVDVSDEMLDEEIESMHASDRGPARRAFAMAINLRNMVLRLGSVHTSAREKNQIRRRINLTYGTFVGLAAKRDARIELLVCLEKAAVAEAKHDIFAPSNARKMYELTYPELADCLTDQDFEALSAAWVKRGRGEPKFETITNILSRAWRKMGIPKYGAGSLKADWHKHGRALARSE